LNRDGGRNATVSARLGAIPLADFGLPYLKKAAGALVQLPKRHDGAVKIADDRKASYGSAA